MIELEYSKGFVKCCLGLPQDAGDYGKTASPEEIAQLEKLLTQENTLENRNG
jgi:hypothetical protein